MIQKLPMKLYYDNPIDLDTRHDDYYHLFNCEIKLKQYHGELLYRDGLSSSDLIEYLMIRTWKSSFQTKHKYTKMLAGFDETGTRLIGPKKEGYILPAFDTSRRITGGIIVFHGGSEWLSSVVYLSILTSQNVGGYPHNLPNGDQPLFVWNFSEKFKRKDPIPSQYKFLNPSLKTVGIISGARKGVIMSFILGIPFIASRSFEFHKSLETLKDYLKDIGRINVVFLLNDLNLVIIS
jgi:hypothetical protein